MADDDTFGKFCAANAWIVYDPNRSRLAYHAEAGQLWQYVTATNTWSRLETPGGPTIPSGGSTGRLHGTVGFDPGMDKLVVLKPGAETISGSPEVWELKF